MMKVIDQDDLGLEIKWIDELYQWADENNIPELQYVEDDDEGFWVGLPRDRGVLLNLEELDLSWHSCTEIPEQIRHLKKLKKFSFAKRKDGFQPPFYENGYSPETIEEIPNWIGELEELEELDFTKNSIMHVPKAIGKLKKLKVLYLGFNRIVSFEPELGALANLEGLCLSFNRIMHIPKAIGKLKNLKVLYLDHNRIMFVEPEFGALANLEELWIQGNKFSIWNDCINKFKNVAELQVNWEQENKLLVFRNCVRELDNIELTDNQSDEFPDRDFLITLPAIELLKELADTDEIDELWNIWKDLSDLRSKIKKITSLKELWCDGLKVSRCLPIKLCPEGLIAKLDYISDTEEQVRGKILETEGIDSVIEIKECTGKGLIEKIDFMELWK